MNGSFSYAALKEAANKAYKTEKFVEAAQLYSKILKECEIDDQERNKIRGNRCLASQKSGEPSTQDVQKHPKDFQSLIQHQCLTNKDVQISM